MPWNWELPDWPLFKFQTNPISLKEKQFFLRMQKACAFLKSIDKQEFNHFVVEILSSEGIESSKIEGEILDRKSLQSSIKQHFGLKASDHPNVNNESGMANILCDVYESYDQPLTHEMLWKWHLQLFKDQSHVSDSGKYRTHIEPMQIVSHRYDSPQVFFEAPPSAAVFAEMSAYIDWFNSTLDCLPIFVRAAISHVYFESIHPFEDGNGRIGRLLVEKALSQGVKQPVLITVSKVLERRKKAYYAALERCNRTLEIQHWIEFFAEIVLEAQEESMNLLYFLIVKTKMMTVLKGQLNARQEKALLRMFKEGLNGFKGGLSAENYIKITKTSRATATRDLNDLVEKQALCKTGELRHRRYWLNINHDEF